MNGKARKILSIFLSFALLWQQSSYAQMLTIDIGKFLGTPSAFTATGKFRAPHLRYFSYDPANNGLKVLLDKGDSKELSGLKLKDSTQVLLKYFLIGVTLPDELFWVNLRPDAADNIIDPQLARTDIGKILLETDLQLKKDTALATSPQTREGKEYWDKLYKKAGELFGHENITIPTLTRPWIVPGEVILREGNGSVYIYKAALKVMLEQDHLKNSLDYKFDDPRMKTLNEYSSQLIRELIIPKLTKRVNTAKEYAQLRQVYSSLILARWFKARYSDKKGTYPVLINKRNLTNLTSNENWSKSTYFNEYKKSFTDGEYNIKSPVYTITGQTIRNYFSGGVALGADALQLPKGPGVSSPIGGFKGNNADAALLRQPNTTLLSASVRNNIIPNLVSGQDESSSPVSAVNNIPVAIHEHDFTTGHVATPNGVSGAVFSQEQLTAISTWQNYPLLKEHGGIGQIAVRLRIIPEDALNTEGSSNHRLSSVSIVLIAKDAIEGPEIYKGQIRIDPLDLTAPEVKFFPLKNIKPEELISRAAYKYIGISMGGDKVAVAIVDGNNEIIGKPKELRWESDPRFSTNKIKEEAQADVVIDALAEMIEGLVAETKISKSDIHAVNAGLAGPLDKKSGIFGSDFKTPNLPFNKYPFRDRLNAKLQSIGVNVQDIKLGNDAEVSRNGERFSPKGKLNGVAGGIVILGGGINIAVGDADEIDPSVREAGHNLVKNTSGLYKWVGDKSKGGHPIEKGNTSEEIIRKSGDIGIEYVRFGENPFQRQHPQFPIINWGEGERDFEDSLSGPSIRARVSRGRQSSLDGDDYNEIANIADGSGYPGQFERGLTAAASHHNATAEKWIRDIGSELGRALAAFIYAHKDRKFVEHLVLVSGVSENLGKGVYESEADLQAGLDIFIKNVRNAAYEDLVLYGIDSNRARALASGIVRSEMDYRRELTAHQPSYEEILAAYNQAVSSPVSQSAASSPSSRDDRQKKVRDIALEMTSKQFRVAVVAQVFTEYRDRSGDIELEEINQIFETMWSQFEATLTKAGISKAEAKSYCLSRLYEDTKGQKKLLFTIFLVGAQNAVTVARLEGRTITRELLTELFEREWGNNSKILIAAGITREEALEVYSKHFLPKEASSPVRTKDLRTERVALNSRLEAEEARLDELRMSGAPADVIKMQSVVVDGLLSVLSDLEAAERKVSSPVQAPDAVGGIDLRSIPMMIQPMGGFSGMQFNLPTLNNLNSINLDRELKEIKAMVAGGIIPSGERLKEYVAACYQKRVSRDKLNSLIPELIQVCRLQEEGGMETDQSLRQALVLVDAI